MKKRLFSGVATALVTPFSEEGSLDIAMLRRLLRYQMEHGVDAVVVCGTTGESPVLTTKEKQEIFRTAAEECRNRLPVIAGVGCNDTAYTIETAKIAESCGADGLLVVTPYYNKTTQAGAIQHYEKIQIGRAHV